VWLILGVLARVFLLGSSELVAVGSFGVGVRALGREY